MEITFWGTRGSVAAPGPETLIHGGNTTCVEVTLSSGRPVVVDAGTGIRRLGDSLIERRPPLDICILMTHIHWDHITGFPFFAPIFQDDIRILIDGCVNCMEGLELVFSNRYVDGTWPVKFQDLRAHIEPAKELVDGEKRIDDTTILSHRLQHPQGGMGFRFVEDEKSLVFLTDNELREDGWSGTCYADFVKFCAGADLLVHDSQYLPEEIDVRKGWGHSDVDTVARLAMDAGVGRLILFHHDPWRSDEAIFKMVERCEELLDSTGSSIRVEAAREGHIVGV